MIFQLDMSTRIILAVIIRIALHAITIFVIGVFLIRWRATKKEWDNSFKPPIIIMAVWNIIVITFYVGLSLILDVPIFMYNLTREILRAIIVSPINFVIGMIVVSKLYDQELKESAIFILIIGVIIAIINFILSIIYTSMVVLIFF